MNAAIVTKLILYVSYTKIDSVGKKIVYLKIIETNQQIHYHCASSVNVRWR